MNGVTNINSKGTQLQELLGEIDGGVFAQRVERALSEVALGTVTHGDKGKKGKVTITFDMARIGESNQVQLTHTVEFNQPTHRGKKTEQARTQTPLHVGRNGRLSLMPDTQESLPGFAKAGD